MSVIMCVLITHWQDSGDEGDDVDDDQADSPDSAAADRTAQWTQLATPERKQLHADRMLELQHLLAAYVYVVAMMML